MFRLTPHNRATTILLFNIILFALVSCGGGSNSSDSLIAGSTASSNSSNNSNGAGPVVWEDTYNGIHYFQTFDSQIQNVSLTASHSVFVWGVEQSVSAYRASSNPKITLSYYVPWAYDPDATHDLSYWKNFHPDWVLYKCDKVTPAYFSTTLNMPLDISNPDVIAWQVQNAATQASSQGYDAIAADEYSLGGWGGCGIYKNGQWKQLYTSGYDDPQSDKDAVAWASAYRKQIHALPHPLGLIPNFQYDGRPLNDPTLLGVVANVDGILDECSFTGCGSGNLSGQNWLNMVTFIEYVQQQGKAYMAINQAMTNDNAGLQWGLASYLMGKEHAAGLYLVSAKQYQQLAGSDLWRSEYSAPIGTPCSAMQATQGAYMRVYQGGLAIVNPSANSINFLLPSGVYTDLYGVAIGASVTLNPSSGLVLLTSKQQC